MHLSLTCEECSCEYCFDFKDLNIDKTNASNGYLVNIQ